MASNERQSATTRTHPTAMWLPYDGSAGTRTRNQRLKRALLYRLSYRPVLLIPLLCRASLRQPTPKAFGAALPIELPNRERVFYPSSHPAANIAGAAFIWISNRADW